MLIKPLFTLLICCVLVADDCRNIDRILATADNQPNHLSTLYAAAKEGSTEAQQRLISMAVSLDDAHWLRQVAKLSEPNTIHRIAMQTELPELRIDLLRLASAKGVTQSDYELAFMVQSQSAKQRLLENAANQNHHQAIQALHHHAKAIGDVALENQWKVAAAQHDSVVAKRHANTLWLEEGSEVATQFLQSLDGPDETIQMLLKDIERFSVNNMSGHHDVAQLFAGQSCAMTIQMVAGSLMAIERAKMLLSMFKQDTRLAQLPVCFYPPVWVEPEQLQCSASSNERLSCQLLPLIELAQKSTLTHAVIIGHRGIANVHNGIMYLDQQDDYNVFVHEFAHFAGFVDEYPLSAELSKRACQMQQVPNLVFGPTPPDLRQTAFQRYVAVVEDIKLTATATCEQTVNQAYKPVSQTTFMEHHDIGVIPPIYLHIWRDTLLQRKSLIPIFVNFAQLHESDKDDGKAQVWWQKYQQYTL